MPYSYPTCTAVYTLNTTVCVLGTAVFTEYGRVYTGYGRVHRPLRPNTPAAGCLLRLYFAKDRRCLGYPGFSGRQKGILRTGTGTAVVPYGTQVLEAGYLQSAGTAVRTY